jgi:LuxR family transcriptional regulator, maltose regulon positive regulatory protein
MVTHVARQVATGAGRPAGADPILESKITVPDVPGFAVQRPRISELLAGGTRWNPLTIVTGPPGTGKTMALTLWAAAESRPVAWVALDRYDNRPKSFWSYVVAALRRSGAVIPESLPADARKQATDHVFLLWLASALAGQDRPVILVLDDFHVLTDPEVLKGLDFVLRNVGPGLRVVVSSRADPPLRLYRYRLAGELAEIRASDLAFNIAEAGLLLAQHRGKISSDSLECLTRRTEGWAAGLRLAAISMDTHPDPDQFVKELITEDSALTGYLVEEVLNSQPPEVQEVLLTTSILEQVSSETASELVGTEQAAGFLPALARTNTFVQPIGSGWYRYHPLFAEVLRLKLRLKYPERMPDLHRRAARLYEQNGSLTLAVRHAARAGDWQLAARVVIDGLAITEIMEPQRGQALAGEFLTMPDSEVWDEPQPYLVSAAASLARGERETCVAALTTAEAILARLPAEQEIPGRLAAAMLRLAVSRQAGDLPAVVASGCRAEALASVIPGEMLARHPAIRAGRLVARGVVELWSGHLDEAVRVLISGAAAASAPGTEHEQAECLGYLALAESLRGGLYRAAELAARAAVPATVGQPYPPVKRPNPAAAVAMALVHLERNEIRETRGLLKQADAALGTCPDKLIGTVAWLVAARAGLAEGHADVTAQCVAKARSGWRVPDWLGQKLTQVESQACLAAGRVQAALAMAEGVDRDSSLEAAIMHARAWAAAGDTSNARRALSPALAAHDGAAEQVRLQAWLVDAQLCYNSGNHARGHRSLASALRLAEREQLRLPFVLERGWILRALERDPELARSYQCLLAPALRRGPLPAPPNAPVPDQPAIVAVEPLTEREREVLRHVSDMLNTAEVASEMYISINTVKTHLKSIFRKLAATHRGEAVRRAQQLELI